MMPSSVRVGACPHSGKQDGGLERSGHRTGPSDHRTPRILLWLLQTVSPPPTPVKRPIAPGRSRFPRRRSLPVSPKGRSRAFGRRECSYPCKAVAEPFRSSSRKRMTRGSGGGLLARDSRAPLAPSLATRSYPRHTPLSSNTGGDAAVARHPADHSIAKAAVPTCASARRPWRPRRSNGGRAAASVSKRQCVTSGPAARRWSSIAIGAPETAGACLCTWVPGP